MSARTERYIDAAIAPNNIFVYPVLTHYFKLDFGPSNRVGAPVTDVEGKCPYQRVAAMHFVCLLG